MHQFTTQTLQFLPDTGVLQPCGQVFIFSDGCAAQYKGRGTFADLTHYTAPVQRVYYGSQHDKGEPNGETGAISKSLDTAVLCRQVFIRTAADLFKWCVDRQHEQRRQSLHEDILSGPTRRDEIGERMTVCYFGNMYGNNNIVTTPTTVLQIFSRRGQRNKEKQYDWQCKNTGKNSPHRRDAVSMKNAWTTISITG